MNSKPTVLITDDERNTREGLERALRARYEVCLAEDAGKAGQPQQLTQAARARHQRIQASQQNAEEKAGQMRQRRIFERPQPPAPAIAVRMRDAVRLEEIGRASCRERV